MSTPWRIKPEVAWTDQDDRIAVLDLDRLSEPPVIFTDSGGDIWRAIDGERNEDSIVSFVAQQYDVTPTEIRQQVLVFLADLAERHLIVRA